MSTAKPAQGKAMYVATKDDRLWLLDVQQKLYRQSQQQPDYVHRKLWGLVTDPRNLRVALARVNRNRGSRSPGIDGITVRKVARQGTEQFLSRVRDELRSGRFRPSPARRVLIPKAGKPGKFRPLGIPTVIDRVVQAAVKNIIEPIFEADFYLVSYGFRPRRNVHGAITHLKALMLPRREKRWNKADRLPYQWAIEGDIKGCFDNIRHASLMQRVRRRIGDNKLTRLLRAFLKSGVMSGGQFIRTDSGTPQGGILSPLLANIALSAIEQRYERHVWPSTGSRKGQPSRPREPLCDPDAIRKRAFENRANDKRRGRAVFVPIRYADDFIILVSAPQGQEHLAERFAHQEKAALASDLKQQLGLELSQEKTLVTPVTNTMLFLGHHICVRDNRFKRRQIPTAVIPKQRTQRLRSVIKGIFDRSTCHMTLSSRLKLLNAVLRGWGNFYRHARGAKRVFSTLDHYVWWTIRRWLRKKHRPARMRQIHKRYGWRKPRGRMLRWRDGDTYCFALSNIRVRPYRLAWMQSPDFAVKSMESPVRNERRTPGSERGRQKPPGVTQARR